MNDYPDIIDAMDKFLAKKGLSTETKQVMAFVVALAHRVQKDVGGNGGPRRKAAVPRASSRRSVAYADRVK